ncbi:MerR family DNA-binding transcriptional regulator [Oceanobacillus locisalsi]|uniref:MerR family DNA-binding transcriptional regulator n=1 Tax=Oceanobacillus locisalsi TaxID=546107 RepID=A0ABW3NIX9_9BACI
MHKNLYSIGETAKLNNISIQSLRYYDKIDLFTPAFIDPESNYRYYHEKPLLLYTIPRTLSVPLFLLGLYRFVLVLSEIFYGKYNQIQFEHLQ